LPRPYANSRRVLHRDLKPGNIMLGKYGETLVVDWGLAKPLGHRGAKAETDERTLQPASARDSGHTQMGSAIGTPQYMSPEQAEGRLDLLGPATDVYSLGARLYCLLTGRAPFPPGPDALEPVAGRPSQSQRAGDRGHCLMFTGSSRRATLASDRFQTSGPRHRQGRCC
jgi:serine/threonine protein kinase